MWHWTSVCAWPLSWLVLDRLWSVQTNRTTLKPIVSARVVWKPLKAIVKISIKMTNIDEPTKNLIEDKFKLSSFGCKLKSSCKLQTAAWNKVKDVKVKKRRVFLTFKRWKQRVFHFPISRPLGPSRGAGPLIEVSSNTGSNTSNTSNVSALQNRALQNRIPRKNGNTSDDQHQIMIEYKNKIIREY